MIAGSNSATGQLTKLTGQLRKQGLHVRFSYKTTRNLGKLLKEANAAHARYAVIVDDQIEQDTVSLKDLDSGSQTQAQVSQLANLLRTNGTE